MKRILIMLLLLAFVFSGFAQDQGDSRKLNISDSKEGSDSKVINLLTYQSIKKTVLVPFLLNLFLGFGIGSFVQGDVAGGLSVLGGGALGFSLMVSGGVMMMMGDNSKDNKVKDNKAMKTVGLSLFITGGTVSLISRLAELIIPFTHAESYNAKLRKELKIASNKGFEPSFNININKATAIGFDLSFKKAY